MSSSTPSADVVPRSPPPSASTDAGSASTLRTLPSPSYATECTIHLVKTCEPYEVVGEPKDISSAESLAIQDRYQFEWWALGLVDARPARDRKKGADAGIDGYINFFDDNSGKPKRIVVQVKSGKVQRNQIATLKSDMEREKADLALFVTLQSPSRPMQHEALQAGFYAPETFPDHNFQKVQILTIEELLAGGRPDYPRYAPQATFQRAPRRRGKGTQGRLA